MRRRGKVFVLRDNIDTDQIIPAQYLNLVPTIPEEYEKLGAYALSGLPESYPRFIKEGEKKSEYMVIVAGKNFGCGSSREHAPICLGASGLKYVVAYSFARIFFRNCIATGEVYPLESEEYLVDKFKTGDEVEILMDKLLIRNVATGEVFKLKDPGPVKDVIEAGGIFEYARKNKMI